MKDVKIDVWVDNCEVLLESAFPFYKPNPFLGDHQFELIISFRDQASANKIITQYNLNIAEESKWESFFQRLSAVWSDVRESEDSTASYLLNRVDEMQINAESIHLKGICSTVLR
ncbi:hypothetical protein [Spirosoma daeguense]